MRVILVYKNFAANKNVSHIGLGVSAMNTAKVLIKHGIPCEVWPIAEAKELELKLAVDQTQRPGHPISHVVVSAPWIPTSILQQLCRRFSSIQFAINCHSNVGFLQADPNGVKLLREGIDLEMCEPNFKVSANSPKMAHWVRDAYGSPCETLPNLYFLHGMTHHHRPLWHGGALRIGVFGAIRPQKNIVSAVGAAIELCFQLKAHGQIYLSTGRQEGGVVTILNSVKEMVRGLPTITLHEAGWQTWPQFRRLVQSMNLLFQPSYTESFNMVTADGIAEGVPSVVGDAIDWVPKNWRANVDDVFDLAHTGRRLLHDEHAAREGYEFLQEYILKGLHHWQAYLA